jgi:hypothetical protein
MTHEEDGNATMYHYCSLEGLLGIIRSRSVWASNSQYLNDFRECKHAQDALSLSLDLLRKQVSEDSALASITETCIECARRVSLDEEMHVFVASFCSQGDKLSQWRAYAQNGKGVSVGFSRKIFAKSGATVLDVVYKNLLKDVVERLRAAKLSSVATSSEDLRKLMTRFFIERVASSKSESFSEEQEIRVIKFTHQISPVDLKFRVSGDFIVPFVEISLKEHWENCLTDVWLGPRLTDYHTRDSIRTLLRASGLADVRVNPSRATFRA